MARRTIRTKNTHNIKIVRNAIMKKGYNLEEAQAITLNLFDTLKANPGGIIWNWVDLVITKEEHHEREISEKLIRAYDRGLISKEEMVATAFRWGKEGR